MNHSFLEKSDPDIYNILVKESHRQKNNLQLIASENIASKAVMEAQGSVFTNKYAEGYPGKRYYSGCEHVDEIELLAIDRLCELFKCKFANVQPHSGAQANQAVFLSLLSPGDTILGLALNSGGHLTHGAGPNLSGKWFNSVCYEVDKDSFLIDMDSIADLAEKHKPKLIIAGASSYPRYIDFVRFREIADSVKAYLLADISHYSGLIAAGLYPSPFPYAHVVTSTTHKTLRGARGGVIMTNDHVIIKQVNSAVFPGTQGGPLINAIAGKAVAFGEALKPSFKQYANRVIANARFMSETLKKGGAEVLTGGTDSHIILVDLRSKRLKGNVVAFNLEQAGIICNKNAIPFDNESPTVTSGLRFGSAAETTRGFDEKGFEEIANLILEVMRSDSNISGVRERVNQLCSNFN
ncbi:MAG: serine hydroxymethyltransferase [Rickettsiaceae bacterium H1]|nr:serine hydroxymethyltransferase [Rickettsiaceae bacterium H1]